MALIVQTDSATVVADADSYLSVADADTYHTEHGNPSTWSEATTAVKESALRYATRSLDDTYEWIGYVSTTDTTNRLLWPRDSAVDDLGRDWSDGVPRPVRDATAELALGHLTAALNTVRRRQDVLKRLKVPGAELEWERFAPTRAVYDYVEDLLRWLGTPRGRVIRLERA